MKQAIILAAGFGTRLKPLTDRIPKPALPVGGIPVLWFNLLLLKQAGVKKIVVNLYHQPQALKNILTAGLKRELGLKIEFSLEKKILGTAGGIAQALKKLNLHEPCWVLNGDIISDVPLKVMATQHLKQNTLATLAVVPKDRAQISSHLDYDNQNRLWQVGNQPTVLKKKFRLHSGIFSGIHLINPKIFLAYPQGQFGCVVQNIYIPLLNDWNQKNSPNQPSLKSSLQDHERSHLISKKILEAPLKVFQHQGAWWDMGQLPQLKAIDQKLWLREVPKNILKLWEQAFWLGGGKNS